MDDNTSQISKGFSPTKVPGKGRQKVMLDFDKSSVGSINQGGESGMYMGSLEDVDDDALSHQPREGNKLGGDRKKKKKKKENDPFRSQ